MLSVAAFFLVFVPVLLALVKLRGDMVIAGANSRVISAACHPHLLSNSSSVSFKSPWGNGYKEGYMESSPKSPRSPRDLRSSHRSRRESMAQTGGRDEWPLVSAWATDTPQTPYSASTLDDRKDHTHRRSSEATVRPLRPESQGFHLPSPLRSPGARSTIYRSRTMSESSGRRPLQLIVPEGQGLMPPPSPYDPRSPNESTLYSPQSTSGFLSRRPSNVSAYNDEVLLPPSPRQPTRSGLSYGRLPSNTHPPSEWEKLKFEPNHHHQEPPEAPSLEPPSAPWMNTYIDDNISSVTHVIRPAETKRRETTPSLITPTSPHRKLPWTEQADPISVPGTPRVPSMAPHFIEKEGAERAKALRKLAGRRLRWGAMPVPDRHLSTQLFPERGSGVGRLGFGSVECGVSAPEVGRVYG